MCGIVMMVINMKVKALRITCEGLTLYQDGLLEVDFIADKRTSQSDIEDNVVEPLFSRIYKLNTLSFIGVNASGKSTTMNVLSDVLYIYLGNRGLDLTSYLKNQMNDSLKVTSYLFDENADVLYKIESIIKKNNNNLTFGNELLYRKNISSSITKDTIFNFDESMLILERFTEDSKFLKAEDSIFSSVMNAYPIKNQLVFNLNFLNWQNGLFNADTLDEHGSLLMMAAEYLDPSIESLEVINKKNTSENEISRYKLKFKGQDTIYSLGPNEVADYLSDGTIKGIGMLAFINYILRYGGYILFDEIENQINKVIVEQIIKLFMSDMNVGSGTLIFSTHYSEILDCIDRTDSIYITEKNQNISVNKYSDVAKKYDQPDKKKSNVILSGVIGTSPSYISYKKMKQAMKQIGLNDKDESN